MKHLMIGTALVLLGAVPAAAQDVFRPTSDAMALHASDFIGMRVYAAEAALDADAYAGVQEGWEDIGEINDIILTRDGAVEAVLVDIGGFLGMGERQVAVDMKSIRFAADSATADNEGDFFLVMNANRAALEGAPAYERGAMSDAATDTGMTDPVVATDGTTTATDGTATTATDGTTTATDGTATTATDGTATTATDGTATATDGTTTTATDGTATATVEGQDATGMVTRDGYAAADLATLTTDELAGVNVYGTNDEDLGEISDFVLADDKKISHVVVDVGGFLGLGSKPVAIDAKDLQLMRADGNGDLRAYVSMTKEQIETLPEAKM